MKAREIADRLNLDVTGNPDVEIKGISYAQNASVSDIAIARSKKEIRETSAGAVVTAPCLISTEKTLLFTWDDMDRTMVRICRILLEQGYLTDYSKPVHYETTNQGVGYGKNVTIGTDVTLEPGVLLGDDVTIGDHAMLRSGVRIGSGTRIGKDVIIDSGTVVGADSFFHYMDDELAHFKGTGTVVIHDGVHIGCHCVIERGTISETVLGVGCMIGNCIDIGHDVVIGRHCKIVSQTGIAGNACVGDNVLIYGQSGVANYVTIGSNAVVKAKTLVSKSVPQGKTVFGLYGREFHDEMKLQAKIRRFFER